MQEMSMLLRGLSCVLLMLVEPSCFAQEVTIRVIKASNGGPLRKQPVHVSLLYGKTGNASARIRLPSEVGDGREWEGPLCASRTCAFPRIRHGSFIRAWLEVRLFSHRSHTGRDPDRNTRRSVCGIDEGRWIFQASSRGDSVCCSSVAFPLATLVAALCGV